MLRITDFRVPVEDAPPFGIAAGGVPLGELLAAHLNLKPEAVKELAVRRVGLDARRRNGAPLAYTYQLEFSLGGIKEEKRWLAKSHRWKNIAPAPPKPASIWPLAAEIRSAGGINGGAAENLSAAFRRQNANARPVVVGFGPAGMFAALLLARAGYCPLVLERGADVEARRAAVENFWGQKSPLNPENNVQFGEGGAGTFSDGKLTTRSDSPLLTDVLAALVEFGAPPEIKILHKPHIGTDRLAAVVKAVRAEIIRLGGEVRFRKKTVGFATRTAAGASAAEIAAVITADGDKIPASAIFLAIGHSARDTYKMLLDSGVALEPKPFAVGLRIEHPQELIDCAQYGRPAVGANLAPLPAADYALIYNDRANGRSAYSFCMCPGGQVVNAASEDGRLVTNGMSHYARDSGIANSALLVNVIPADWGGDVLGGIEFQRRYEAAAFRLGGGDWSAPVEAVGDFLAGKAAPDTRDFLVAPTFRPDVRIANLHQCLPDFVRRTLADGLENFGAKIGGFAAPDIPLTGVEMRSSAPCRILRDKNDFASPSLGNLYPIGEGAGYAGGIMSAAADGLAAALAFLRKNKHNI